MFLHSPRDLKLRGTKEREREGEREREKKSQRTRADSSALTIFSRHCAVCLFTLPGPSGINMPVPVTRRREVCVHGYLDSCLLWYPVVSSLEYVHPSQYVLLLVCMRHSFPVISLPSTNPARSGPAVPQGVRCDLSDRWACLEDRAEGQRDAQGCVEVGLLTD